MAGGRDGYFGVLTVRILATRIARTFAASRLCGSGSRIRQGGAASLLRLPWRHFKLQIIYKLQGIVMAIRLDRRTALQVFGLGAGSALLGDVAFAQAKDSVTIGWPSDVPSWDPNQRFTPDAQPIYKLVFDQPLDQNEKLDLIPKLITKWELAADGKSMSIELRDDVTFHDGSKMTTEDFRYTFFERIKAGHAVDTKNSWRKVTDIEIQSPTKAVMKFDSPAPTAPQWMSFLGSFMVPKDYMEKVGVEAFREKPVGTGPYKLVEYQLNSRIVLERNDNYWGPKPKLKRIVFDDHQGPVGARRRGAVRPGRHHHQRAGARCGAPQARAGADRRDQSDHARDPAAGAQRPWLRGCQNVRLAAHHAIDKDGALEGVLRRRRGSAVRGGDAGNGGIPAGLQVRVQPGEGQGRRWRSPATRRRSRRRSSSRPTNGHFPSDYDIARAIVQMWKQVGIDGRTGDDRVREIFRAQPRNQAARGDAL